MEDNFRKFVAKTLILIFLLCLFVFLNIAIASASPPQEIKITNVRDTIFTVSWITDQAETCQINYGPTPTLLNKVAYDVRGGLTSDDTHYVTISGLSPITLYYFDIVSNDVTYDNGGAHYTCTTGPTIAPPSSDTVYGRVFKEDEITPANGTIVYIKLKDNNGTGSPGFSAEMSALVDSSGYWNINLGNARTQDLSTYLIHLEQKDTGVNYTFKTISDSNSRGRGETTTTTGSIGFSSYFSYSSSGDNLILYAQGAGDGIASQTIDTADDFPAANMVLSIVLDVEVSIFNDTGYAKEDKFFNDGNTVYIQANVTSGGSPVVGATVSAKLKVSAGTITEATVSLTDEVGGGIYTSSWSSTAHTADVYLVEVSVTNPTGSGQAYFHLYSGSGVSAYRIDYNEDGNNDYVLENKHLISVYDGVYAGLTATDTVTFSSTGESLTSSDLNMVAYITDTTPVTASFNLSIKMKSQDVDYLVYNLSNFNAFIDDISDLFCDIAGTIGANVEDDRYHIGDGTDDLVTTLTSSTWADFYAAGKFEGPGTDDPRFDPTKKDDLIA